MLITQSDYEKIMELVGTADTRSRTGGVAVQLKRALQKASALPPEEIGSNVLTMNSRAAPRDR